MSARQQSKHAAFARAARRQRRVRSVIRANRHDPAFVGAVFNFKINGVVWAPEVGALFARARA